MVFTDFLAHQILSNVTGLYTFFQQPEEKRFLAFIRMFLVVPQQTVLAKHFCPQSIQRGQWEAAHSLGLTKYQMMRYVILPQAFQRILPPMAGQFVSLIKDSSIVSVISIPELSFRANELMTGTLLTMEIWITVTIMYLVLTLPCSLAIQKLEDRVSRALQ